MADAYVHRLLDGELAATLRAHPAVLVTGPRACGKTTTARQHAASVVRLDRAAEAAAFEADPDAALATVDAPVLLDEWQAVPGVLGAVKRAVDDDSTPGRFILTGSVRADLEAEMWPGTGRLIRLNMFGFNERELASATAGANPVDVLAGGDPLALAAPLEPFDVTAYLDLAARGSFPDPAIRLRGEARVRWLASYLDQILTRDAVHIGGRDPVRLSRYFEVLALNSAGVVSESTIFDAAGINRQTAVAYERLIANLFVMHIVPAWHTNRLSRLAKMPKRYITDPALIGSALRLDARATLRDGDMLGRVLDTFVAAQIRSEAAVSAHRPRMFHLRERNGRHEVDIVLELGGERIIALEVKATAAPSRADAVHLEWLREQLGDRFVCGVVLHTGPSVFPLADRIAAAPIASLWASR